jgi:hypothetical protein
MNLVTKYFSISSKGILTIPSMDALFSGSWLTANEKKKSGCFGIGHQWMHQKILGCKLFTLDFMIDESFKM